MLIMYSWQQEQEEWQMKQQDSVMQQQCNRGCGNIDETTREKTAI